MWDDEDDDALAALAAQAEIQYARRRRHVSVVVAACFDPAGGGVTFRWAPASPYVASLVAAAVSGGWQEALLDPAWTLQLERGCVFEVPPEAVVERVVAIPCL